MGLGYFGGRGVSFAYACCSNIISRLFCPLLCLSWVSLSLSLLLHCLVVVIVVLCGVLLFGLFIGFFVFAHYVFEL